MPRDESERLPSMKHTGRACAWVLVITDSASVPSRKYLHMMKPIHPPSVDGLLISQVLQRLDSLTV
jgi:hypothetical protein